MKAWRLFVLVLVVLRASSGCAWVTRQPELGPEEVAIKFYRWYIGYPGNPLVDREYRESPYLAESFVGEVDEILAGDFRADPVLLAQDIPERFTVDQAEISQDQATVVVLFYWGGNSTLAKRSVDLRLIDGEWRITDVSMVES